MSTSGGGNCRSSYGCCGCYSRHVFEWRDSEIFEVGFSTSGLRNASPGASWSSDCYYSSLSPPTSSSTPAWGSPTAALGRRRRQRKPQQAPPRRDATTSTTREQGSQTSSICYPIPPHHHFASSDRTLCPWPPEQSLTLLVTSLLHLPLAFAAKPHKFPNSTNPDTPLQNSHPKHRRR